MNKFTLSACLIIGNDMTELEKWVADSHVYADEIIIVDTSEGANARNVLKKQLTDKLQIITFPWQNDFAAARNQALSFAKGEWIVFLDGDEFFAEPAAVREYIAANGKRQAEGIMVSLINTDEDAYGREISRFPALRIWRNRKNYRFEGKIHEALYNNGAPLSNLTTEPELKVIHTGYSAKKIREKLSRNLAIIEQEIREYGEQPRHLRYLAECCEGLGEPELALHFAKRALREEPPTLAGKGGIYRTALQAMQELDSPLAEQLAFIEQGIDSADGGELLLDKATLLLLQEDWEEARLCVQHFMQLAEQAEKNLQGTTMMPAMLPTAEGLLGRIALQCKDLTNSEKWLSLALQHNPYQPEVLTAWEDLCRRQGRDFIATLADFYPEQRLREKFLTQWCIGEGQVDYAATFYPSMPLLNSWHNRDAAEVYEEVIKNGTERYFSLVYAMLCGGLALYQTEPQLWRAWLRLLPQSVAHVVQAYIDRKNQLSGEDLSGYKAVLMIMSRAADDGLLDKYVAMSRTMDDNNKKEIINILLKEERWLQAYSLLASMSDSDIVEPSEYWYARGKCECFLKMPQAESSLRKAVEAGCKSKDIEAFLQWLA